MVEHVFDISHILLESDSLITCDSSFLSTHYEEIPSLSDVLHEIQVHFALSNSSNISEDQHMQIRFYTKNLFLDICIMDIVAVLLPDHEINVVAYRYTPDSENGLCIIVHVLGDEWRKSAVWITDRYYWFLRVTIQCRNINSLPFITRKALKQLHQISHLGIG